MGKKINFLAGILIGIVVTGLLVVGITLVVPSILTKTMPVPNAGAESKTDSAVIAGNEEINSKLSEIDSLISRSFLYSSDLNTEEQIEGIFRGYVAEMGDPYSRYFTVEETQSMFESMQGSYVGIGIVISEATNANFTSVVRVYPGTPAEEAGVLEDDIILTIDGEDAEGLSLDEVVSRVRGPEGTTVDITFLRGLDSEKINLTIERRSVEIPSVVYEMKENQLGYIFINSFDAATVGQFESALTQLQDQGMKGYIVDLRRNGGGSLAAVCAMLDLILPEGIIVYTEDKNGERETEYSTGDPIFTQPMVVLVDGASASASEIFAGAVQDYEIGKIVGATTFGKGVVQQIFGLGDGSSVKLTISEYFTPKGRAIEGIGVTPDVEVPFEWDSNDTERDNQLEEAIQTLGEMVK